MWNGPGWEKLLTNKKSYFVYLSCLLLKKDEEVLKEGPYQCSCSFLPFSKLSLALTWSLLKYLGDHCRQVGGNGESPQFWIHTRSKTRGNALHGIHRQTATALSPAAAKLPVEGTAGPAGKLALHILVSICALPVSREYILVWHLCTLCKQCASVHSR